MQRRPLRRTQFRIPTTSAGRSSRDRPPGGLATRMGVDSEPGAQPRGLALPGVRTP